MPISDADKNELKNIFAESFTESIAKYEEEKAKTAAANNQGGSDADKSTERKSFLDILLG